MSHENHDQAQAVTDRRLRRLGGDELVTALRALASEAADQRQLAGDVRDLLELAQTPAILHAHGLTPTKFKCTDDVGANARSIGVINPSAIVVYLGIGGISPQPGQGAIEVPAGAWAVLPVEAASFGLGADAAAIAGVAGQAITVYALRFASVQPLFRS